MTFCETFIAITQHVHSLVFYICDSDCKFAFSSLLVPETTDNQRQEVTTPTPCQQSQRPIPMDPTEVTTIDGNIDFTGPVNVKINNRIKINTKNNVIRMIPKDIKRTVQTQKISSNRQKVVRPKADETSSLCTIM